jgi:elongation factor P
VDRTFRAGEKVDQAVIDRREHQFLYRDDTGFHFMDMETYAQIAIGEDLVGDSAGYLGDNAVVVLHVHQGRPIGVDLPPAVELAVTYAEPAVKGDRVSGATKPVTLETGLVVQAPLFVDAGDRIKVSTASGEYITRVT